MKEGAISWTDRLAELRHGTGSRTWLRILLGTAYLAAGTSVAIIFSADPGQDVRWAFASSRSA